MAKVGEGDPRWIVTQREDGRNVNNWHWTEQDWTDWARKKLEELLLNAIIENDIISVKINKVITEGDVSVNTRKQKTILFYELNVSLNYEGTHLGSGKTCKGTVQLPYISEENDPDDFEIKYLPNENTGSVEKEFLENFRKDMTPLLKKKIPQMINELKDLTVLKIKLPPKVKPSAKIDNLTPEEIRNKLEQHEKEQAIKEKEEKKQKTSIPSTTTSVSSTPTKTASTTKSKGISVSNFTIKQKFYCSAMDLFLCFIDPNRVKAYAGGDSEVSSQVGGKMVLFGGSLLTENLEIIPGKKIVQKWRFTNWPQGHFSTVTMEFTEKEGKTILHLKHTDVPSSDLEHTKEGWNFNYFNRIKGVFGFGGLVV